MATTKTLKRIAHELYTDTFREYTDRDGNTITYRDAESAIKNKLKEMMGGEKYNYYKFQENKWGFYNLISELISDDINRLNEEVFSPFCDFENFDLGDKKEFTVENTNLFKVANIADGVNSTRRQRLLNKKVPTTAFKLSVAIYEEAERFITGRINWVVFVNRVSDSYHYDIARRIAKTFEGAYSTINAKFQATGNSDKVLLELIAKVEGATGKKPIIYGTPLALSNLEGIQTDLEKEEKRKYGFIQTFRGGYKVLSLPNAYDENAAEGKEWALDNKAIYVIPDGEKIIKLGTEGDVLVIENTDEKERDDQQIEYFMAQKIHLGVVTAAKFGVYKIQ
ncbi:TPA: hypothetical protein KOD12_000557 [Clostridioides difficile]|nr:hypothetical protein [Clostridioides difficile]HBF3887548.1 hypothetical protein [Clostridioides difficile]